MMVSRRTVLAGSAVALAAPALAVGLRRRGPLPAVRAAASVTPATVTFSIQNNTKSDAVYVFVTGQALDNGNALMLLQADGHTPYYPAAPSGTGTPLAVNCAIPLNASGGAPITITVPHLAGARLSPTSPSSTSRASPPRSA